MPTSSFLAISQVGPYCIVPRWIARSAISDRAVRVYVVLSLYADHESGVAYPAQQTIAEACGGCSIDSVDRALKELVAAGAIVIEARRQPGNQQQLTNLYHVMQARPEAETRSAALRIGTRSANQPESRSAPVRENQDPELQLDPVVQDQALPECEKLTPEILREIWNEHRGALPECQPLSPERKRKAAAAIKAQPDREIWIRVVKILAASKVCDGKDGRWRSSFDHLLRKETVSKALEGAYDWDPDRQQRAAPARSGSLERRIRDANVPHVAAQGIFQP